MSNHRQTLRSLRSKLQALEGSCHCSRIVTTGSVALDGLLGGGMERGTLVEWLGDEGCGSMTLAMIAAREACHEQGTLVIVDERKEFYPPAVAALGIDLDRTIFLQPQTKADFAWCLHQSLRSQDVAAVLCQPGNMQERMLRRFQLAAERGGVLGLLIRPIEARRSPSWAKVRILVEARCSKGMERRWRLSIVGSHDMSGKSVEVEIDHESGILREASPMPVASALVSAAARREEARAKNRPRHSL